MNPEKSIRSWTNNCPNWIVDKAIKDFGFYKGLDIPVDQINTAPTGLLTLNKQIIVTPMLITYMMMNEEWVETYWKVSFPEGVETIVRQEIAEHFSALGDMFGDIFNTEISSEEDLDPYIPGFSYELNLENKRIRQYYRGWLEE